VPNAITIRFYDNADQGDTHGVNDLYATFTTEPCGPSRTAAGHSNDVSWIWISSW
jgi:hypothetical protein